MDYEIAGVLPENTIDFGENPPRFDTLYINAEDARELYIAVDGKRYLLSDLIETYDAINKQAQDN